MKAIVADLLIDGTGGPPVHDAVVLIEGERIKAVGTRESIAIPAGAEVITLHGETLLPGLVDAHSHPSLVPARGGEMEQMSEPAQVQVVRAAANLRADLKGGVTTMRVAGEEFFIDVTLRDAIESGTIPGPRLIASGPPVSASHGHGAAVTRSDGVEEIRRRIRDNIRRGAQVIKIFATGGISTARSNPHFCFYSKEEIQAAVEECRRVGVRIMAHAHGGVGVRWSIEAGVDSIEHGKAMTDEDIELMVKKGTWLVVNYAYMFHPEGVRGKDWDNPLIRRKVVELEQLVEGIFRKCYQAGVKIAAGTDSMHGAMWYELKKMVDFGASPMDAIVIATRNGADVCGLLDEVGTLEPGKLADIISVKGNPLDDIEVMQRMGLIMKAGQRFDAISVL